VRALGLTSRQRQALDLITRHIAQHGVSPTYDEMQARMGLRSKSGIHRIVVGLERRGAIVRSPRLGRSIALPTEGYHVTLQPTLSAMLERRAKRFRLPPETVIALAVEAYLQITSDELPGHRAEMRAGR
jgi:SOS-response transcriptional repressor LexA